MRVLVVSHGHPAFSIGGAEMAAHNLFRAIRDTGGHEAWFLARAAAPIRAHGGSPLMSLCQGSHEVFLHNEAWDHFNLSNDAPDGLAGFASWLRHVDPHVVHFHHFIGLGMEAIALVRRVVPDAAIVVTFHEYLSICIHHGQMVKRSRNTLCYGASPAECSACFPEHDPGSVYLREQFLKNHLSLADLFVSPSHFLIDRYVRWGLPEARFRFVENGLDARPPAPPRTLPPGGRRDRFGFFGQISEFKGLHVLLDAVGRVPDAVWGDASLCIFGGNLENQPETFRKRFGELLEAAGRRVRFFGSYRADELPRLMGQVDWTVMPSVWWENSPLVIQESFLHRRPLIVSDIGGMAEKVRDGIDGLHFRAASPEDLAERMAQALSDGGLWDRLSAAAPAPSGLESFAAAHLALYEEATAARACIPQAA
jgi:glycosyltransferase involved in cell wall biosynthesis